jgi:Fe-S-cluster containining protein
LSLDYATMLRLTDEQARVFADAVAAVGDRGATEIRQLYEAFESERAVVQPRCDASGACCRFEAYGHRLFITTLEMAAFCRSVGVAGRDDWDGTGCVYQVDGRCSAHVWRPFGCRVYFCDERTTRWQQDQYERTHAAVRALHDRHSVPYLYVEWRAALKACGIAVERPAGNRLTILH